MIKILIFFRSFPVLLRSLWDYLGASGVSRQVPITDSQGIAAFIQMRSSHVAQISLYGYLRTRSGALYPKLFDDDGFMVSVNIAKWQMWIACLSDLSLYVGGLILARTEAPHAGVGALIEAAAADVLDEVGHPEDAGDQFVASRDRLLERIRSTDWGEISDDESAFTESPDALVEWAPVIDELKELDSEVVRNSVRFRWQDVRRDLRRDLDAEAVLADYESQSE